MFTSVLLIYLLICDWFESEKNNYANPLICVICAVCVCNHISSICSCVCVCVCVCVCLSHLQSVCPHEFLCGSSSSSWYRDTGVAGDQYGGAGQDVSGHQAGRHRAKVGVKCSGCRGSSIDIGCKAGCDWKHGLWAQAERESQVRDFFSQSLYIKY